MLINYSISGSVLINNRPAIVKYVIRNITTGFISKEYTSELGYYNINLSNFPDTVFNKNDIIVFNFYATVAGINYFSRVYNLIDPESISKIIDVSLKSNWNYYSDINIVVSTGSANIKFITNEYENILFKLYILYNGKYKEIDTAYINKQILNLTFTNGGDYKIGGYVVKNNELLTYTEKNFSIANDGVENKIIYKNRYIEWE